ncbi:MAG TPA: carboxypeptidase-like regulatory domain-containing protein [Albitalea sp.]|nr:carboxypeptidase-like regulatory domain-containing protein [Albitalea sp.]
MKPWPALRLLACAILPAAAHAAEVSLAVRETATLAASGASAAFAVDATTVEATIVGGQLVLVGRHAGRTPVTIITPERVETITVNVRSAAPLVLAPENAASRRAGTWETSYDSATGRVASGLAVTGERGDRTVRLRVQAFRESAREGGGGMTAVPHASLEIESPGSSVVLLDQRIAGSPLTLDGVVLRGLHMRQGGLQVHAGISSVSLSEDMLPRNGDRALGVAWRSEHGGLALVPAAVWLPDSGTSVPGALSLGIERGGERDALRIRADLGWSDKPAASADVAWRQPQRNVWLSASARPAGFAGLRVSRLAGRMLDAGWSERPGERLTLGLGMTGSRLEAEGHRPEATSWRADVRHQTTDRWSLTVAMSGGTYRDGTAAPLRRSTAALGTAYDLRPFGIAGQYRIQQVSASDRPGHGGQLTMRATPGPWKASLFLDAQQEAPTLDVVLRDRPDLARALDALGIAASTPEDLVRLWRDNAALFAQQGVSVGGLRLDSWRMRGGLELSWRKSASRGLELGLRLALDDARSVAARSRSELGTLQASWRFANDLELSVAYTQSRTQRDGVRADTGRSIQVALRTPLATLGLTGGGRISGQVVRDEPLSGDSPGRAQRPASGVEVLLDGQRRTRTQHDGTFSFDAPGPGSHRVEALLPPEPGSYFTAPSTVNVQAGGEARFSIALSAARLQGFVRSDAGLPLAGVTVRLDAAAPATATTDSSGAYRFASAPGEAVVSVVAETIPPGHELADLTAQHRTLETNAPSVADFSVRAQRTMSGLVRGQGDAMVTVTVLELKRSVTADAATGRFVLRGLPAGALTLQVDSRLGRTCRIVTVPKEPGALGGLELSAAPTVSDRCP